MSQIPLLLSEKLIKPISQDMLRACLVKTLSEILSKRLAMMSIKRSASMPDVLNILAIDL